jgi:hypothetical protein
MEYGSRQGLSRWVTRTVGVGKSVPNNRRVKEFVVTQIGYLKNRMSCGSRQGLSSYIAQTVGVGKRGSNTRKLT